MTYRFRNIAIAGGLALVAALLTIFYVTNYKRSVQGGEDGVTVYVAARDVAQGTKGTEVLEDELLKPQEVAKRNVAPGAISSPEQISGLVAADPIYAGEQVTTRRFTSVEETGIRSQISGNLRAFELPGEPNQLLQGTLQAGDHVDVVGSWAVPESASRHFSRTVLRDILVLKAAGGGGLDANLASGGNATKPAVVLAVTDSQAQKLFWLARNGEFAVELRPTDDPTDSPETAENAETLLLDGLKPEQLRQIISLAEALLPRENDGTTERTSTDGQP